MKLITSRFIVAALSALALSGVGMAQDRYDRDAIAAAAGNLYVVSAKAGGVNHVEGDVTIQKVDGTSSRLIKGKFVKVGDAVATGSSGRAEILMNPGSFIRLNHDSEFRFDSTTLSDLKIFVKRGTAIFEVYASDDFKVTVESSESRFYLIKSGVYRIDVDREGTARLEVWKGRAQAGDIRATKVKKGRSASIDGDLVAISKFSKNMDSFEKWSKTRAKAIAKATRKLDTRRLGSSVLSSFRNYSWDCYDSVGLWIFNRQFRSYSFLPFGYGWRSPYGHRLSNTDICYYPSNYWRSPRWPYSRRPSRRVINPKKIDPKKTGDRIPNRLDDRRPPFKRMQKSGGVKRSYGGFGGRSRYPSGSPRRTRSKNPSKSNPARSVPAPRAPRSSPVRISPKGKIN